MAVKNKKQSGQKKPESKAKVSKGKKVAKKPTNKKQSKTKNKDAFGDDPLYQVALRKQYYKDGAKYSMVLLIASLVALSIAIATAFYSVNKKTENKYLITNPDGTITKLIPLSRPNQSEAVVRNWLVEALVTSLEFNYVDYRKRLNKSISEYFTEAGGSDFVKSIDDISLFETIEEGRLLVGLDITTSPILMNAGNIGANRAYGWTFQTKGLLTLRNERTAYTIPLSMQITITRRSLLENPKGLGIARVFIQKDKKING